MKMNISLDFKTILSYVLKRFSLALWVLLAFVIIAEGFTIKSSINKIQKANEQTQFNGSQLIRVNFTTYDSIEKRLNSNSSFVPAEPTTIDPFGLADNPN